MKAPAAVNAIMLANLATFPMADQLRHDPEYAVVKILGYVFVMAQR
jgi:hypothetical protein